MIGRIGYGIPELKLKEHKDRWAESSLEIKNYMGKDYIWFCIRYEDEAGEKTYYSAIVEVIEEDAEHKYNVICRQKVQDSFVCCNMDTFSKMVSSSGFT